MAPRKIHKGTTIPYGTLSDADQELRTVYYYYGYRRDEDLPELPVMEPEEEVHDPEEEYARKELYEKFLEMLEGLTPRESLILKLRFGFGCSDHTLEQLAKMFDVSRERIRQIEAKAIRKFKNPFRRDALKEHLDPESSVEKAERLRLYAIEQRKLSQEQARQHKERRKQINLRDKAKVANDYDAVLRRPAPWLTHLKDTQPNLYARLQDIATKLHHRQMFEQYEEVQLPDR